MLMEHQSAETGDMTWTFKILTVFLVWLATQWEFFIKQNYQQMSVDFYNNLGPY